MGELVWLNDRLMPLEEARIHPLDRGFLYGDGLFETMRSYDGVIHLLYRHLERLREGGVRIELKVPSADVLCGAISVLLQENNASDARVRITLSRGVDRDGPPTLFIRQSPLLQMKEQHKNVQDQNGAEKGVRDGDEGEDIDLLPFRRRLPEISPRLKSLNYLPEILAQDELRSRGLREGLLLTPEGDVAEGSVSNIFCVVDGELLTPPIHLGILPGITRARVIELANEEGITVAERSFLLDELLKSDECFYTNSVRELVPVRSVDGRVIGTGKSGPVTLRLLARYRAEIPNERL